MDSKVMTHILRTGVALGQNDGKNYIRITYETPNQFKENLQHELLLRSGKEILDLVIIVSEARRSIQSIEHILEELVPRGTGYWRVDGSYKFIRKSELNQCIASRMQSILVGKVFARDLVRQRHYKQTVHLYPDLVLALPEPIQHEIPEARQYLDFSFDGGLNSILSSYMSSILGDPFGNMEYPSLVIEVGDSQSTSEVLFKSLLHARAKIMPANVILTADVQVDVQDDEITISRFDLHHLDFSIENLGNILHGLPTYNENEDVIQKRESLKWAIGIKCQRLIAQLDCLLILVQETSLLYQALDQVDSEEASIKAQKAALRRMDERITALIPSVYPRRRSRGRWRIINDDGFLDDWLETYRDMQQLLGSLGDHGAIITRIEEARQYYSQAQLASVDLSHSNYSEAVAIEQVIALVLDTHITYPLNSPEKIVNGLRIPVSSFQFIPTGQDWIDVTPADLQELHTTAMSYIAEKIEGVTKMIIYKEGIKHRYRSQFLEMVRGNSTMQTLEELFGENNYMDMPIRIGFVSTDNIVAYIRSQGMTLNPGASRIIAVSKLLELSAEEAKKCFLLRPHTMEFIHSHRRSEAAVDILASLGQMWDQDPWKSLQEFVRCQRQVRIQLALKYLTNDGLVELLWMRTRSETGIPEVKTREERVRILLKQYSSNFAYDWRIQTPDWIDNIMINVRVLDRLLTRNLLIPTEVVELLKGATDLELQRKITDAAFADPGSFAVVLQTSSDLEELLTELNMA
uniref:ARAD1C25784p n=1 Tax=Blastobotrys adeninivorans TaxID=409370 RepID=A0A060T2J7_BLAAD